MVVAEDEKFVECFLNYGKKAINEAEKLHHILIIERLKKLVNLELKFFLQI